MALLSVAERLASLNEKIANVRTTDREILDHLHEEAWLPCIRFVLETSRQERVSEIVNETIDQVYQSGSLALNTCLVVSDDDDSMRRLRDALSAYREADAIVAELRAAIAQYEESASCRPR